MNVPNQYKGFSRLPESVQQKMDPSLAQRYQMGGPVMQRPLFRQAGGPAQPMPQDMMPPPPPPAAPGPMGGQMGPQEQQLIAAEQGMAGQMEQVGQEYAGQMMAGLDAAEDMKGVIDALRGNDKPLQARYNELADLVGPEDAQATPESVLALVQPTIMMTEQGAVDSGIGELMQGIASNVEMETPGGAPTPMAGGVGALMAQGAGNTPPANFSQGGPVRLQGGGDPTLESLYQQMLPTYQSIMGDPEQQKQAAQSQAVFAISDAAGRVPAGQGAGGQDLRGLSPAAQLAGATTGLGAQLGALGAANQQQEQAMKLAALQAAQGEYSAITAAGRATTADLAKFERQLAAEIAREERALGRKLSAEERAEARQIASEERELGRVLNAEERAERLEQIRFDRGQEALLAKEERANTRAIAAEERALSATISAEERAVLQKVAAEGRAEAAAIRAEGRAADTTLSAEERAEARRIAQEARAEATKIAGELRQVGYTVDAEGRAVKMDIAAETRAEARAVAAEARALDTTLEQEERALATKIASEARAEQTAIRAEGRANDLLLSKEERAAARTEATEARAEQRKIAGELRQVGYDIDAENRNLETTIAAEGRALDTTIAAEERAEARAIAAEERALDTTLGAEDRAIQTQIAKEARAETRAIAAERRANDTTLSTEERAEARRLAQEARAEATKIAGELRQVGYDIDAEKRAEDAAIRAEERGKGDTDKTGSERLRAAVSNQATYDELLAGTLGQTETNRLFADLETYISPKIGPSGISTPGGKLPVPAQNALKKIYEAGGQLPAWFDPTMVGLAPEAGAIETLSQSLIDPEVSLKKGTGLLSGITRAINYLGEQTFGELFGGDGTLFTGTKEAQQALGALNAATRRFNLEGRQLATELNLSLKELPEAAFLQTDAKLKSNVKTQRDILADFIQRTETALKNKSLTETSTSDANAQLAFAKQLKLAYDAAATNLGMTAGSGKKKPNAADFRRDG